MPAVVAVNRRPGDTDEEVELVKRLAIEAGAFDAQINEGFEKGGVGAADLAEAVVEACDQPNDFHFLYPDDAPIREKIEAVATKVYGAKDVYFYAEAEQKIEQFNRDGPRHFPICMAKTPLSLSSDAELLNSPEGFTLPVRDIRAYTGAGWLVPLAATSSRCRDWARRRPRSTSTSTTRAGRSGCSDAGRLRDLVAIGGSHLAMGSTDRLIADQTVGDLLDSLAARTPAPGGEPPRRSRRRRLRAWSRWPRASRWRARITPTCTAG